MSFPSSSLGTAVSAARALAVAALSAWSAAAWAQAPVYQHVIHISVDGLGGTYLDTALNGTVPLGAPTAYPNFLRLQTQGASTFNARTDYSTTFTLPDHTSMFTGLAVLRPTGQPATSFHNVTVVSSTGTDTLRTYSGSGRYLPGSFDVAHDHGLKTSFFASKDSMAIYDRTWNATNGALDTTGANNGRDKIDAYGNYLTSPLATTNFVSDYAANGRNYGFLHLVDPDTRGHLSTWGSIPYYQGIKQADDDLGLVFAMLDANPALAATTAIVLTADHGGGNATTEHGNALDARTYTVPMFLYAPGIAGGTDLYSLFSNRFDPGTARPDYNFAQQPLRNGDAGNLSLELLGLGFVPASIMQPILVPEPGGATLLACGACGLFSVRRRRQEPAAAKRAKTLPPDPLVQRGTKPELGPEG